MEKDNKDKDKKKLRRDQVLFIRMTPSEKAIARREARAAGLNMEEWGRCKCLNIPFENISGRIPRRKAGADVNQTAQRVVDQATATPATP